MFSFLPILYVNTHDDINPSFTKEGSSRPPKGFSSITFDKNTLQIPSFFGISQMILHLRQQATYVEDIKFAS